MNPISPLTTLFSAAAGLLLLPPALLAGLPQPMCVYYGQALDGYGMPYRTNAEVILLRGTNQIARQTIGPALSPGVNFALYVHLDDGRSATPYSPRALRSGDVVSMVVHDAEGVKTIMENRAVPPVGQPGDLVLINVTAAEDADGDGLPDTWEQELIAWSDGRLTSLEDVRPGDDFDGDGMSNLSEYRAGTFAFLDYDYLAIEWLASTPGHRLCMTFLSVTGKTYRPSCSAGLSQGGWTGCPFALSDDGAFQTAPVDGTGDWLSFYVPIEEAFRFFRLEVR